MRKEKYSVRISHVGLNAHAQKRGVSAIHVGYNFAKLQLFTVQLCNYFS